MAKNPNRIAIVTFGLRLKDDGKAEKELDQRVDTTIEQYERISVMQGARPLVIMSGNRSAHAKVIPPWAESSVMTRRARRKKVPQEDLEEERDSLCTWGNIILSRRILERFGLTRVVYISSGYHLEAAEEPIGHIMNDNVYEISLVASDSSSRTPEQLAYMASAALMSERIKATSTPGNIPSIEAALAAEVPLYAELGLLMPQPELAIAA